MPTKTIALLCIVAALPACRTTIDGVATATEEVVTGYSIRKMLPIVGVGVAAYYVIDPLAPNWEVSQQQIGDTHYRISLRMKRFHAGGEGEAEPLFTQHAAEIAEQLGAGRYRLLSYTEGIDSQVTVPQRWAKGTIELLPAPRPARTASR